MHTRAWACFHAINHSHVILTQTWTIFYFCRQPHFSQIIFQNCNFSVYVLLNIFSDIQMGHPHRIKIHRKCSYFSYSNIFLHHWHSSKIIDLSVVWVQRKTVTIRKNTTIKQTVQRHQVSTWRKRKERYRAAEWMRVIFEFCVIVVCLSRCWALYLCECVCGFNLVSFKATSVHASLHFQNAFNTQLLFVICSAESSIYTLGNSFHWDFTFVSSPSTDTHIHIFHWIHLLLFKNACECEIVTIFLFVFHLPQTNKQAQKGTKRKKHADTQVEFTMLNKWGWMARKAHTHASKTDKTKRTQLAKERSKQRYTCIWKSLTEQLFYNKLAKTEPETESEVEQRQFVMITN